MLGHFYRRCLVNKRFAKFRASAQGSNCDIQASPRMLAQRNSFLECSREITEIVFEACSPHFPTARNFANRFSTYHEVKGQPAQVPDTRKQKASQPRIQIPESQGPASARSRFQEVTRFQMPGIQGQASPDSSCQKVRGQPAQVPGSNPKSGPDLAQI